MLGQLTHSGGWCWRMRPTIPLDNWKTDTPCVCSHKSINRGQVPPLLVMSDALLCVLLLGLLGPGLVDLVTPQAPDIRDLVSTGAMSVCELPRLVLAQLRELILTSITQVKICMEQE